MAKRAIPLVDLAHFTQGDAAQKEQFVEALGRAFHEVGFVGVINHGISEDLTRSFYDLSQQFFAMDKATKERYEVQGLAGQRGYTSFGKEHAKQSTVADLKEFYQIGQEVEGEEMPLEHYPANIHVQELPDFVSTGIALYKILSVRGVICCVPLPCTSTWKRIILSRESTMAIPF
jgi:isopenicillin N synthase-like dioxygenase